MADLYTNPANLAVRPNRTFYSVLDGLNEANDRSLQSKLNQLGYDKQRMDQEEFAKNATLRDLTRQTGELEQQGKLAALPFLNSSALEKARIEASPEYTANAKNVAMGAQEAAIAKARQEVSNANLVEGLRASAGITDLYNDPKTRGKAVAQWRDAYKTIPESVVKWAGFTGDINKDIDKITQLKAAGISDPKTMQDMALAAQKAGFDYKQAIDVANIHAAAQLQSARISASSAGVSPLSTDKLFAQTIQEGLKSGKITPEQAQQLILQKGGVDTRAGTLNLNTQKEQFDRLKNLQELALKKFPLASVDSTERSKAETWISQQMSQNPVQQPKAGTAANPIKLK